jgi:two-component system CheB/CheR fusion protein
VVQHLDPDHNSTLTELLARKSQVPVTLIKNDMPVEPDHIYVIPPNADLTINNGRLYLAKPAEPRGHRYPIDRFFVSLAQDQADKAACVILSGTGSDGTLGLRAIKENGGLTLAQAEAEYDGMMRSALGTGLVDFVLPAAEMPAKLADYFRYLTDVSQKNGSEFVRQQGTDYLTEVCALLRARTGHDFKDYKDKTIVRRIQRRMQVLQIDNLPDLIARLRKDPREIDLLFQDLLIGVTDFFRDPKAFETLEKQVIPHLFEGKGPEDRIRVWVPGCSTGEEAYSIAMLLREGAPKPHEMPKLQIFASDIDEHALATARVGRYPASIAKDVALERLERFFMREDGTYRIVSDLRETCLFSSHDLLRDAPFSKLDLISCRNLLIYLNPGLQDRVIPLFNYALRDEGYLFLGTSENVSRHSRLFTTIDKTHRLFRRRPQTDRRLPEFPLTTPDGARLKPAQAARPGTADMGLRGLAERQILDRYAPAYVIINAEGEVLQSSARTGRYLELPAGAPDHNIYNMARRGLRLELRNAVHNAVRSGQVATQGNISVGTDAGNQTIDLIVQPLATGTSPDGLYMIVFRDVGEIKPVADQEPAEPVENANLRHLEMELRGTRERLQTTTEELESSNEELKSGNEELSSINEELQSANEELETAKEELQSINEELQTVNTELNARVEELSRANSDMANLLESTQIATVFLDRSFTVKSFTPAAKDVFRLVESDTGRPITHVRARFGLDTVQEDAERVLRTLGAIEKQVHGDNGSRYIMRILPYRTVDNVINGVVITFTDVTRIAAAEARIDELTHDLRNRVDSLETLLDLVPVGILIAEDDHGQPIRINQHGARLLGESDNQHGLRQMTRSLRLLEHGRELPPDQQPLARAGRTGETVPGFEGRVLRNDGSTADVMISATPLLDDSGEARGAIAAIVDISQRKRAEAHQETLLHELQHRVKNVLATVSSLASRMLKSSGSKEEFSAAFLGRLSAMGDMHELLSRRKWEGADLGAVAKAALAPHANIDKANIQLGGPDLLLAPGVATTLGMALHELATNAAKFGALSSPKGRVDVVWDVVGPPEGRRLSLTWAERNGPAVTTPGNDGFGTYFVKRSIEYELDGTAQIVFEPDGLRCVVDIPLSLNGTRGDP